MRVKNDFAEDLNFVGCRSKNNFVGQLK